MELSRLSGNIGTGLVAGALGTAAMTVSSTLEARLRGRQPSTAPADAARRVLGIEKLASDAAEQRFSQLVHWGYGTGWGVVRGVLRTLGLRSTAATVAHFGAIWGSELVLLPALEVSPPATRWGAREVGIDAWHHVVYVTATALAYELLSGGAGPPRASRNQDPRST